MGSILIRGGAYIVDGQEPDNLDHLRYRVARVPAIHLEKLVVEAIRAEAGPIPNLPS
jgi:hypothetical protein